MNSEPKIVASLFIPLYGAMAINKTLEMIRAAHAEAKFVDFIFDNEEGLSLTYGSVTSRIDKASFSTFVFDDGLEGAGDDEDMPPVEGDGGEGNIVYSMNQEMRTITHQFRMATLKDSLHIQLMQSADSHAPDLIRFVINETREFCNPTTQTDQLRMASFEADVSLVKNMDTSRLNAAHSSFRDSRMRRASIASRRNPHNNKSSLAIQAVDGAPRAGTLTNVYYIDGAEELEEPVEFTVDLKSLNLFKQLSIMSSSASLSVENDEGSDVARHFVLVGTLPKGFRPVTEDAAQGAKSKKKSSSQPAVQKIGQVVIRIPCASD